MPRCDGRLHPADDIQHGVRTQNPGGLSDVGLYPVGALLPCAQVGVVSEAVKLSSVSSISTL